MNRPSSAIQFAQGGIPSIVACSGAQARREPDGAWLLLDEQGLIRSCGGALGQMLGGASHSLVGKPIAAVFAGLAPRANRRGFAAVAAAWPANAQWRRLKAEAPGSAVVLLDVELEDLRVEGVRLFLLRLRLPAEDDLRRLIDGAERSDDAVMVTDTAGVIVYVNAAFEAMTGFSRNEVSGQTPGLLKSGIQAPELYRQLWATIRAGREFRAVFANRAKGGRLFHEEKTIRPFVDARGQITHFVANGRDVTERIRALRRVSAASQHERAIAGPVEELGRAEPRRMPGA